MSDEVNGDDWGSVSDSSFALCLYVAGTSPVSVRAINNLTEILERYLLGRYELDIIDAHQQPELAKADNILAIPVLVKKTPIPKRLLVGDMSNQQRVLRGLGLNG